MMSKILILLIVSLFFVTISCDSRVTDTSKPVSKDSIEFTQKQQTQDSLDIEDMHDLAPVAGALPK